MNLGNLGKSELRFSVILEVRGPILRILWIWVFLGTKISFRERKRIRKRGNLASEIRLLKCCFFDVFSSVLFSCFFEILNAQRFHVGRYFDSFLGGLGLCKM